MENNKNKKSVKFQGDMLNFCDFIQVFVFTRNHHLNFSNMPIFFVEKNVRSIAKASLIFSTKIFSVFGYKVIKHLTS